MISLTNHHSQWGCSEVVIIYPDICFRHLCCTNKGSNSVTKRSWTLFAMPKFPMRESSAVTPRTRVTDTRKTTRSIWGWVKTNSTPVVHMKIAGKWMFIPLQMVLIGIDPYPNPMENPMFFVNYSSSKQPAHPGAIRSWLRPQQCSSFHRTRRRPYLDFSKTGEACGRQATSGETMGYKSHPRRW